MQNVYLHIVYSVQLTRQASDMRCMWCEDVQMHYFNINHKWLCLCLFCYLSCALCVMDDAALFNVRSNWLSYRLPLIERIKESTPHHISTWRKVPIEVNPFIIILSNCLFFFIFFYPPPPSSSLHWFEWPFTYTRFQSIAPVYLLLLCLCVDVLIIGANKAAREPITEKQIKINRANEQTIKRWDSNCC